MRTLLVTFLLSQVAMAYDFPLLEKRIGGLNKDEGVVLSKSCQIFDDHKKIKIDEVIALIGQAQEAKIQIAVHVRETVPSIEIWANYPEKYAVDKAATGIRPKKVLLVRDSSDLRQREGEAAKQLTELTEKLCADLK